MGILYRLKNLWRRERLDSDIEAELRAHLEMSAQDAELTGSSPEEARRMARLRFGNPLAMRERTAWADTVLALDWISKDLGHTVRQLRQSPVFTATAVITLALGIGATTAIFTLVQQVMLRTLPVAQPGQLWRVGDAVRCCHANGYAQDDWSFFSWEAYKLFRANTPAFEDLAAFQVGNAGLGVRRHGSAAPITTANGEFVSGNFFQTFGVSAWRGRAFNDTDDREGAPPVAVMSFHTWQENYGSDASVVGATYQINGHSFTIVGVAPPGFYGVKTAGWGMPDFWMPLTTEPLINGATARLKNIGEAWLDLIGRVRPGTNPKTLEAQLRVELHQWLESHVADMSPQEKSVWEKQTLHLTPGGAGIALMREDYKDGLRLLLLAAVCVLLVACANTANLLLARGLKDRPQTALRAALGASRPRLVSKALLESLTLSLFGAVAGVAVAYAGARLILHLAFTSSDGWLPVNATPSTPVLLFALGVSVITGIVFGMAPAWMTSQADPIDAMRGANRILGGHRGVLGMAGAQKALVISQAAVSLVLLSAAAMLGQSLRNLEHQNFGFETRGRFLVQINSMLSNYKPEQLTPLFRDIEDGLRAIPGVRMASAALYAPLSGMYWSHPIRIEGKPEPGPMEDVSSAWTRVSPGFFETVGDSIVMGRPLTAADNANTRRVAVINETFAKRFLGKENPIGHHFGPAPRKNAATYEIVGVAADVHYVDDPLTPMYFLPEAQSTHFDEGHLASREIWSHYPYNIVIWAPGNPPDIEAHVKRALAEVDPNLIVNGVEPYSGVIHGDFAQQNMIASLTWLFGAVGLVLAAVGLYGVTAYGVEQRTSEIGVRMALGADRGSVVGMLLGAAFWQVGIGLALGIPAAIGAGYLMASQLFGVRPWDARMLAAATLLLALATLIAAAIPARRAASVDPIRALRAE
ncbi:MAG TPA: ABC transporter permease [Bryobacteraceae bacterium]|nr:ABC transporter permease [Bryobacteraceae bacterium]